MKLTPYAHIKYTILTDLIRQSPVLHPGFYPSRGICPKTSARNGSLAEIYVGNHLVISN